VVVRALNGLSFHFVEGDRIGVMGHNGSGKTTLLRVIAGAYEPVSGTISVVGKVATMIAITLGMDPESTGYETFSCGLQSWDLSRVKLRRWRTRLPSSQNLVIISNAAAHLLERHGDATRFCGVYERFSRYPAHG